MKTRATVTFVAALFAAATAAVVAQQPPDNAPPPAQESFGEEVSVDVVNLEVWVSDAKGNPVPGLSKDDFQLVEDGKLVDITNFSSYTTRSQGATEATGPETAAVAEAPASGEPRETAEPGNGAAAPETGISPENSLYLSVLIDNWTVRPEDRARALDGLRDFLDHHLRPEDRVMIAAHDRSIQLVQPFTSDRQALARALDRVARSSPAGVQLRSDRKSAMNAIREAYQAVADLNAHGGLGAGADPCTAAWGDMEAAARSYSANLQGVYEQSGGALVSMAQILAGVPGRKMLVYVGGALEQTPGLDVFHYLGEICPHHQSDIALQYSNFDVTWLYEQVAKSANSAGVTFYMLEAATPGGDEDLGSAGPIGSLTGFVPHEQPPEGSSGGGPGPTGPGNGSSGGAGVPQGQREGHASHGQTFRPSTAVQRFAESNKEDGFSYLAHETGGRAILDAGDFKPELTRLASDLRSFYSLGFLPIHHGDGRVHHLEVKVPGGDGYVVRYRRTYVDEPPEERMAERVRGVAQFGTETNPLGVRIETGEPTAAPGGVFRVPIRLWVPLGSVTLLPKDGGPAGRLRVLMAYSDTQGKLGPVRQKEVPVTVTPDAGKEPDTSSDRLIEVELDLAPGSHEVAVGVRDELGGGVSYLRHHLEVAALAPEQAAKPPR